MKNYIKPEMQLCIYNFEDVLSSSGITKVDGVYDYDDVKGLEVFD